MKVNSQTFPYPMLTPADAGDDYINGSFECALAFSDDVTDDNFITLQYSFMLTVDEIFEAINMKNATFSLEINCPETLYRTVEKLGGRGFLKIDATQLHGRVNFTPLVVLTSPIANFKSVDFNPEYGNQEFDLMPGDILATDIPTSKYVEFTQLSINSLVKIRTDKTLSALHYTVDPTPSYLYISMGEGLRLLWSEVGQDKNLQPYLTMSIYKDCLYVAIEELICNPESETHQWARALALRISEMGIELPTENDFNVINLIAQRLVQNIGVEKIVNSRGAK